MPAQPSFETNLSNVTATYQALASDDVVYGSANSFTVTLPKIVPAAVAGAWTVPPITKGSRITVVAGSGTITVAAAGGDTIATPGSVTSLTTVSDGVSAWLTLS